MKGKGDGVMCKFQSGVDLVSIPICCILGLHYGFEILNATNFSIYFVPQHDQYFISVPSYQPWGMLNVLVCARTTCGIQMAFCFIAMQIFLKSSKTAPEILLTFMAKYQEFPPNQAVLLNMQPNKGVMRSRTEVRGLQKEEP